MRRIPSGTTDQYVYFVAVDAADLVTRETGLSSFTVYRSRDGGAAAAYTTPTVNETDATNMPGVYELLLDEDMTIGSGNDSEEVCLHITKTGMAPVTLVYELYRPKITAGNTLDVTSTGAAGIDWGNIENKTTANDLSGTDIQLADTVTTLTGHTAQTGDSFARIGAAGAGLTALATQASVNTIDGIVDAVLVDTGTTLPAQIAALNNLSAAEVAAELATYDGPTNTEMAAAFTEIKGATWATTDTLEAIRDRGDAAWTTATGFSTHSAADVWSVATRVLTANTNLNDLDAAGVRAAVGLASADLDTQLAAIVTDTGTTLDGKIDAIKAVTDVLPDSGALTSLATASALTTVDSNVDAIKAKTDSLTFTVAGEVDANIQSVNDVTVTGDGQSGTEWGPA